jgi:hypothetical protein
MLVAFQRVAADQFGETVSLMRVGRADWPHFVKRDLDAALGELPCCFRAGQAASDY